MPLSTSLLGGWTLRTSCMVKMNWGATVLFLSCPPDRGRRARAGLCEIGRRRSRAEGNHAPRLPDGGVRVLDGGVRLDTGGPPISASHRSSGVQRTAVMSPKRTSSPGATITGEDLG